MDETADFYAYYIFKILGRSLDEEIPIEDFKNAIFNGTDEQKEILTMFCMADVNLQDMYKNDQDKYEDADSSPNTKWKRFKSKKH